MSLFSKNLVKIYFLFLLSFTLPAYANEVFSQDSSDPQTPYFKKTLTNSTVNRKTIERLRERVVEYLAYRPQGPKLYYLQKYFEYKFSIPTTDRKLFPPELQDKFHKYFRPLEEKTKKESLERIDNIRIVQDNDNYAYVVILPKSGSMIKEVLLWVYTYDDWYPYPAQYPNNKGILPIDLPTPPNGVIFR